MKLFKRILTYTKSHRLLLLYSIISSVIYVILNSMSIWLIGTMLANVMSGNSSSVSKPTSLNEYLDLFIQNLIGTGSQIEQLKSLCILSLSRC